MTYTQNYNKKIFIIYKLNNINIFILLNKIINIILLFD